MRTKRTLYHGETKWKKLSSSCESHHDQRMLRSRMLKIPDPVFTRNESNPVNRTGGSFFIRTLNDRPFGQWQKARLSMSTFICRNEWFPCKNLKLATQRSTVFPIMRMAHSFGHKHFCSYLFHEWRNEIYLLILRNLNWVITYIRAVIPSHSYFLVLVWNNNSETCLI